MAITITLTDEDAHAYMEFARRGSFEGTRDIESVVRATIDPPVVTEVELDPATLFAQAQTQVMSTATMPLMPPVPFLPAVTMPLVPPVPFAPAVAAPVDSSTSSTTAISAPVNLEVPTPPAGTAPTVSPSSPPAIVPIPPTYDKAGLPWDQRIHSASKAITKEGLWRTKRNVEESTVATVTAELRSLMALPTPAAVPPVPPLAPLTAAQAGEIPRPDRVPAPPVPTVAVPVLPVPPASPVASSVDSAPPAPPAPTEVAPATVTAVPAPPPTIVQLPDAAPVPAMTFPTFVQEITKRKTDGRLTQAQIDEALASMGVPKIPLVAARPDLIPSLAMMLGIE